MLSIKLFNKVAVNVGTEATDANLIDAFNLEVASFGYSFDPLLIDALRTIGNDALKSLRETMLADLAQISGANRSYRRLFNDFPYSTPDQHDYMEKRVLGHIANEMGITLGGNRLTALSCGHVIDSALFNVEEFGACPICQMQVPELLSPDEAVYDYKALTPLRMLSVSTDGFRAEGNALLARTSSLSEDEKAFLRGCIADGVSFDMPSALYRENVPFAFKIFGSKIAPALSGATDILRIATFLSKEDADLSLSENTKFKLSTSQKREVLELLEQQNNLAEDMLRHREKWLRLGERLNPSSSKNKARFPKTATAFDRLRNNPNMIVTFNKQMEESLRAARIDQAFIDLMVERPGEFARKLDVMLRKTDDTALVVTGFAKVVSRVAERTLLDLRKYLASRNDMKARIFLPKGRINKMQVVEDSRAPLSQSAVTQIIDLIDNDLIARYAQKEALGKVYIDPALKEMVLPFNRRGDSSTSANLATKGSRFPFNADVIRMFVWWHDVTNEDDYGYGGGRVDVDLSISYYDSNMEPKGYVSFQNLRSGDAVSHSGDIQSAPNGASEFIDFDVEAMKKMGVRYVAASVLSYTGQSFDKFECFAGYMERDALRSGKVYEPQSVKLKFDISTPRTNIIPLLFDVVERKVIYADLSAGSRSHSAVSRTVNRDKALTEAMLAMPDRKPTAYDVAYLNAVARGEVVDNPEDADVIFDIGDVTALMDGTI